jgi:hypothetical protein
MLQPGDRARINPENAPPFISSTTDNERILKMDTDGHGPFRDLCLTYGDFYRPVFLETIMDWFVRSASSSELAALRKAISSRAETLHKGGKRGRPRGRDSAEWLGKGKGRGFSTPCQGLDMA